MQTVYWSNNVVEFVFGNKPSEFYVNISPKGKSPVYADFMDEIELQLDKEPVKRSFWKRLLTVMGNHRL